jgi:hypothetical protein
MSRTIRRRKQQLVLNWNHESIEDIVNKCSNDLNRTMLRQVTLPKKKKKNAESEHGDSSPEIVNNSKVINVNVIVLHSAASYLLHQHLRTSNPIDMDSTSLVSEPIMTYCILLTRLSK